VIIGLDTLSWLIVLGNASSALLTGPLLIVLLGQDRAPRYQQFGWVLLLAAQGLLILLGVKAALAGFAWGPPVMIAVAVLNWTLWVRYRRQRRAPVDPASEHALSEIEQEFQDALDRQLGQRAESPSRSDAPSWKEAPAITNLLRRIAPDVMRDGRVAMVPAVPGLHSVGSAQIGRLANMSAAVELAEDAIAALNHHDRPAAQELRERLEAAKR